MNNETTIVVADDHPIFRHGLMGLIEKQSDFVIVGEAENGTDALRLIKDKDPDVVILDIDMPDIDGIEIAREMNRENLRSRKIFLTMLKEKSILRAMKGLDVKGYVLKDSATTDIVDSVRTVIRGKIYLSPEFNELLLEGVDSKASSKLALFDSLTESEKRVLKQIAESKTNREIAETLFISVRTVETHRYNVCTKLDLRGTHALFKFAVENREKILRLV